MDANPIARQRKRLSDADASVRFWSAAGLFTNGEQSSTSMAALRRALEDPSESVRAVAARALCASGDCERALQILDEQMAHEERWVELRAVHSIRHLGSRADLGRDRIVEHHGAVASLRGRDFFREADFPQWVLRGPLGRKN